MKQVTKCYGCNKITRIAGSFKAEIGETIVITNEYGNPESRNVKKKIVLCRSCAREAGYKVKQF